jgi:hypothetical protein
VIDLFGVHESIRRHGAGKTFYGAIMDTLKPKTVKLVGPKYLVSVQSTYDYASFANAVVCSAIIKSDEDQRVSCAFNKQHVAEKLTGACQFWRRMGFNSCKLIFSDVGGLLDPVLVMWKKSEE